MIKVTMNNKVTIFALVLLLITISINTNKAFGQDTLYPQLKLNKNEIDLCSGSLQERDFYFTLNLGKAINSSDSLILTEIAIAFRNQNVVLDGILLMSTMAQQFVDYPLTYKVENISDVNYKIFSISGGNISKPIIGGINTPFVVITGRYIGEQLDSSDIFITNVYFNEEFKHPYYKWASQKQYISGVIKNLAERTLNIVNANDLEYYEIQQLEDTLSVNYLIEAQNKKKLFGFIAEFEIENNSKENIYITDVQIADNYNASIKNDGEKVEIYVTIQDTTIFSGIDDFCTLKINRINKELTNNSIICKIVSINELSCSMNNEPTETEILCDKIESIEENLNEELKVNYLEGTKQIIITALNKICEVKLYDILGNERVSQVENLSDNSYHLNIENLGRGIYIAVASVAIEGINYNKILKLIIN